MKLSNVLSGLSSLGLLTAASSRKFRPPLGMLRIPRTFGTTVSLRSQGQARVVNQRRRRPRRTKGIQGLEINRAEGGFKSIIQQGTVQMRGINLYGRLIVNKIGDNWVYEFAPEWNNYAGTVQLDVTQGLNQSEEFKNLCQHASQYKVIGCRFTLDYSRIPEAKDRLSRLLLSVSTDKIKVEQPKLESNVMNLSMTQPGVKNFNFNLNVRNMDPLNLAWQNAQYLYAGNLDLYVNGQDLNEINDDSETTWILGTWKLTIGVLFRFQDYEKINQPFRTKPTIESLERKIDELKSETSKI